MLLFEGGFILKTVILKEIRNFILCFLGLIICFLLILDFAYYYDTLFFVISLVPIIALARFLDDHMRDTIIILRDNQTLVASIITIILLFLTLLIAYFIFTNLMNQADILEIILDFIAKFIDVAPLKEKLNI